ncbi:MAG TPA: 30S ribosomal protein S16 [Candidatus Dormibacteraeota bacterium]|nr:30S ribosomal protein S16 [Candidatus Dormibacteraeota bacterium]
MGAKKRPFYRLVVADSRSPRDGRFIELLGYYDPLTEPAKVQVDADKVREWMSKGARPSDAARDLLVREGILAKVPRAFRAAPVAEAPAAAAPSVTARETPGSPEEVDAVDAENVHLDGDAPGAPAEAEPAAAPAAEPADDGGAAEAAAES